MSSSLLESPDRVLSTLERDGSRRWLNPKLARGRFLRRRRAVAYLLIALFTLIPYIQINGKPAILLDIVHRRFTLFGYSFLPTDTVLLALLLVTIILGVFIVTALLGRVWCGWACPQTVYMEFVFRPLQRLCTGRTGVGGKPNKPVAAWRNLLFAVLSFMVCLYLAHTFLAYFVGVEALRHWIFSSPLDHPASFLLVLAVTALMLFNFGFFREQTCIIACPYGRFQSVMLDKSSLIISYDKARGEPRGKGLRRPATALELAVLPPARTEPPAAAGDCVDCSLCVQVCPTGIDIRDGLQIECVGCAQCIDACDTVMDKISRPRGLIRYTSQEALAGAKRQIVRPRVVIYAVLITGLLALLGVLLATKSPTDVTLLRALGKPFDVLPDGRIQNIFRLKITNRSDEVQRYRFEVDRPEIQLVATDTNVVLQPGEMWTEPVQLLAPAARFDDGKLDVMVRVTGENASAVERPARLLGPHAGHEKHEKENDEHDKR